MDTTISIYLDTRREKEHGLYPVKLRVYSNALRKAKLYPVEKTNMTEKEFSSVWQTEKPRKEHQPKRVLQLFTEAEDIFCEYHENPLQAVEQFTGELDKHKFSAVQKIFLHKWVCKYLAGTEFEKLDLTPIKDLLECKYEKLKAENEPVKPLVKNIRENLKDLMQKEVSLLPETLKGLDPVQRLNILCKLMPYVFPKVEAVDSEKGEHGTW